MGTIEERAIRLMNTLPCEEPKSLVYEAYKLGATEQKAIDIDKACKRFEYELGQMVSLLKFLKGEAGKELIDVNGSVTQFRQALEE